jgi:Virulence factor
MARFQVLFWQDIPSVVKALDDDGSSVSRQLPDRFQDAIDRRAMQLRLTESDAYLEQWQWSAPEERPGSARDVVDAVADELERGRPARDQAVPRSGLDGSSRASRPRPTA